LVQREHADRVTPGLGQERPDRIAAGEQVSGGARHRLCLVPRMTEWRQLPEEFENEARDRLRVGFAGETNVYVRHVYGSTQGDAA
jgi:hypothetical protein